MGRTSSSKCASPYTYFEYPLTSALCFAPSALQLHTLFTSSIYTSLDNLHHKHLRLSHHHSMRHPLNAVIALLCLIISFLPLSALSRPLRLSIDQRPIPSEGSFHIPIHQRDSIPLDSLTPAQLSSKLGSLLSAAGKKYGFIIPAQGLNVRKRGLPTGFVQMGAEVQD